MLEVLVQIERRVFNPTGVADLHRALDDAAPEGRDQMDSLGKELARDLERRRFRGLIHALEEQNAQGMHGHFGCLCVEHRCVEVRDPNHSAPPLKPVTPTP